MNLYALCILSGIVLIGSLGGIYYNMRATDPDKNYITVIACLICASASIVMLCLATELDRRERENTLMASYTFSIDDLPKPIFNLATIDLHTP